MPDSFERITTPPAGVVDGSRGFSIECHFCGHVSGPGEDVNIARGLKPHNDRHRRETSGGDVYYVPLGEDLANNLSGE